MSNGYGLDRGFGHHGRGVFLEVALGLENFNAFYRKTRLPQIKAETRMSSLNRIFHSVSLTGRIPQ